MSAGCPICKLPFKADDLLAELECEKACYVHLSCLNQDDKDCPICVSAFGQ
jgi:hypothetical protein